MSQLFLRSRSLKRVFQWKSRGEEDFKEPASSILLQKPSWKCFSYEEIYQATNGFHKDNLVGIGGHAEVYRGVLKGGQTIAVKRLTDALSDEKKEKEFLTELGTVSHVKHQNVCSLIGCCIDNGLHLVFALSCLGSVSYNLHDKHSSPMPWDVRYKIAVGTARGLHYLHKECQRRIIHRDIKASNILLAASFEPQISDFGLARWLPSEWTHRAVSPIEGSFGCLAPEYFTHGLVDEKTDVFAFGIFLLELVSGKKPVDGSHKSLLSWAKPHLNNGNVHMLVDSKLGEDYDISQQKRIAFVASLCIREIAIWRPSMTEVLNLMEDGEILFENWKMPAEEAEIWGFEDLDEYDSDIFDGCDTPSTSSSLSI